MHKAVLIHNAFHDMFVPLSVVHAKHVFLIVYSRSTSSVETRVRFIPPLALKYCALPLVYHAKVDVASGERLAVMSK